MVVLSKLIYKIIVNEVFGSYVSSVFKVKELYFYKYFIGLISLVSKEWYSIVNTTLVIPELSMYSVNISEDNVSNLEYLHYLLKRGIRIEKFSIENLTSIILTQHNPILCEIVCMWRDIWSIDKSLLDIDSKCGIANYLGNRIDLVRVIKFLLDRSLYIDCRAIIGGHLPDPLINEINQHQSNDFIKLEINGDIFQYYQLPPFHSNYRQFSPFQIRLNPTNLVSVKVVNVSLYFEEYINFLSANPQLQNLNFQLSEPMINSPTKCVIVHQLIEHRSLLSVHISGHPCFDITRLCSYLNCNSILQKLYLQSTDTHSSIDNFNIVNNTLKSLNIKYSHHMSLFFSKPSGLESLESYSVNYQNIRAYHPNLTSLSIEYPDLNEINITIPLLKHLQTLKLNVTTSNMKWDEFLQSVNQCTKLRNLEFSGSYSIKDISLIKGHPTLQNITLDTKLTINDAFKISAMIPQCIFICGCVCSIDDILEKHKNTYQNLNLKLYITDLYKKEEWLSSFTRYCSEFIKNIESQYMISPHRISIVSNSISSNDLWQIYKNVFHSKITLLK
ncbi:hypothetical protein DLAC_04152 [Tieghemostelium lacteum]|uniref:Uncharacterized protein n=1 Tax=Tieghemostelium lacteum TaxID=361077 RepID=A0A151ZSF7_TIELA|nr:hypothetical protein DLAC_04152 [Tieghemostelium lacteum]|eukprot:KYQ96846.1 hypothetical protein DLAC_04152 [Tieghemostelium lacteum]